MNSKRLPILSLFILFCFGLNAQTPNYDSTFTALFKTEDDSSRADKLFFLFDDMYLYETESTAQLYLPLAKKMLNEATKNKNTYGIGKANQALAYLYKNNRQFDMAYKHCAIAEKQWARSGYILGQAELKFFRAGMMVGNREQEEVVVLLEDALNICRTHHLNKLYVNVAGFLSANYGKMGKYEKTIALCKEILSIPGITQYRKFGVYNDMGIALESIGKYKEAGDSYNASLQLAKELGLSTGAVIGNLASLALTEKKLDLALSLALEAEKDLEKSGHLEYLFNNAELLTRIYTARKEFDNALKYSKRTYQFNDSLNKLERQSEYMNLDKKYQAGLKDKTIAEQKSALLEEEKRGQLLIFSIVGLVVVSVFSGILFYTNRKRKELKLNQSISESEMKALRAQMNPHFMFNSLNAIQQMVMNNENDNAFRYLDTYSKLTRQILENSEKKWITVKDEMKFLELYLEIESLRFEHAFRYKIEASDEVMPNSDRIPAMVVQPIVENAIKHGLLRKDGDKNLLIRFDRKDEKSPLEVVVEDNGLGRAATLTEKKESDHHSMSLGITENRLQLLDATGGSRMEVEDLHSPDGNAAGTRVHIYISQNA